MSCMLRGAAKFVKGLSKLPVGSRLNNRRSPDKPVDAAPHLRAGLSEPTSLALPQLPMEKVFMTRPAPSAPRRTA